MIIDSCFVRKRLKFWFVEVLSWICTLCRGVLSMMAMQKQTQLYGELLTLQMLCPKNRFQSGFSFVWLRTLQPLKLNIL